MTPRFFFVLFSLSIRIGQARKDIRSSRRCGNVRKRSCLRSCGKRCLWAVGKPAAFPSGREYLFSVGGAAVFHISIVRLSHNQAVDGEGHISHCHQQTTHQDKAPEEAADDKVQHEQRAAAQDLPRQLHADPVGLRCHFPRLKRPDEVAAQVRALVDGMAAGPCKFNVGGLCGAAEGGHQQLSVRLVGIADIVDGRFQR